MNETEWRAQNKYSQLTIDKGAKAIQWSKDFQQIFKQMMLEPVTATYKEWIPTQNYTLHKK